LIQLQGNLHIQREFYFTREPRGFAFINFMDPKAAKKALEELNGKDFKGKPLKVEFSKR